MGKKRILGLMLLLLLLLGVMGIDNAGAMTNVILSDDYTPHDPILIESNADLIAQGWLSDYTFASSCVIERLMIISPYDDGQAAIRISNRSGDIRCSITIRNCLLYDVMESRNPMYGIVLKSMKNVVIEGNIFEVGAYRSSRAEYGIHMCGCCNTTVINNRISISIGTGIVDGGSYWHEPIDTMIEVIGERNTFTNNTITRFGDIEYPHNTWGMYVASSYSNVFGNSIDGFYLSLCVGSHVHGGNITWNGFVNNNESVRNFAEETFFDYNYWPDYNGSDANSDGIGDVPYEKLFEGSSLKNIIDNHPLMCWPWPESLPTTTPITTMIVIIGGVCGVIALIALAFKVANKEEEV